MSEALDKTPVLMRHLRKALEAVTAALAPKLTAHRERIEAIERLVAQLQARPSMNFVGAWEDTSTYEPGDVVQRRGLWLCKVQTAGSVPGRDFKHWRLVVKEGNLRDD